MRLWRFEYQSGFKSFLVQCWMERHKGEDGTIIFTSKPDRLIEGILSGQFTLSLDRHHRGKFRLLIDFTSGPLLQDGQFFHFKEKLYCQWRDVPSTPSLCTTLSVKILKARNEKYIGQEFDVSIGEDGTRFSIFDQVYDVIVLAWHQGMRSKRREDIHFKQPGKREIVYYDSGRDYNEETG